MSPLFRLLRGLLPFLLLVLLGSALHAQVRATLVSEAAAITPGQSFLVALRMDHEEHWHSYWKNPGTGLPTTLAWKLPEGFSAGEIQWPAPLVLRDVTGSVSGYGYEGVLLLPVRITAPAGLKAGQTVRLHAEAAWLMCKESCVPGKASLDLELRVADKAEPAPAAADIAAALRRLPAPAAQENATARLAGKLVSLEVRDSGADMYFFSNDGFVSFEAPQEPQPAAAGRRGLLLPVTADFGPAPARLAGVLVTGSGASATARELDLPLLTGAAPQTTAPSGGLGGTLLLALVGGLILNLMPCVFPVLGIKILGFVQQAGSERRKVIMHGLVFTAGVLLSFWSLAGLLTLLRAGGSQLGWGFQLQSPAFVYLLAMLMLVFALNMSGLFEFGLGATAVGSGLQSKEGLAGSFFTGVLATVVATPCSAPFLAPALGAALTLSPAASFAVFTSIGVGLSTPYLLLSIFPAAVRLLPRPGAWMEGFRQLMAFPLYGTVGYLLWVLAGQVEDNALLSAFLGTVLVAMGAWLYGRWNAPGAKPGRARAGLALGLALSVAGLWAGWPASERAPDAPVWEHWSPARLAQLRSEGRTVYVDFTARWCATCQANKRLVFGSSELRKRFAERKVVLLKGDWTNRDPEITAELAHWNRSAVPFNLIYQPGKADPIVLPELLTAETVLRALE
jgi:thiol:disulfide interchange protein DsbD